MDFITLSGPLFPERTPVDLRSALGDALMDITIDEYNRLIAYVMSLGLPNFNLLRDVAPPGSLALVCGSGPSIANTIERIREAKEQGAIIFAVNGCHDYLIDNGIVPHFGVLLDPAPRVATYQKPHKDVRYLIGASVHSSVWRLFREAGIRPFWFVPIAKDDQHKTIMERYPDSNPLFLSGATTVGLRTINLARVMGFQDIEGHGFDSCYAPKYGPLYAHDKPKIHADNREMTISSQADLSRFICISNGAMARQILGFQSMLSSMNQTETNGRMGGVRLLLDGDGAIPWIAWKEGGAGTYVEHRDPERMTAKYGTAMNYDYAKDLAA